MSINKVAQLTTSQAAQALLTFKGKKFSLDGYRPFREIYDIDSPSMTVMCSRQVGKTLSIGAIKTTKCVARPFLTSIYVSPLSAQASRFSTMYLDPFIKSPLVNRYYRDASSKKNVFEKTLNNGSIMFLSYAETEQDADRVRGIAGDLLNVDEVQDVALEALPILYETLSASDFAFKRHYGTAKSELNTLATLFKRSNGCEWVIKCEKCGKYSIPWTLEDCLKMCSGKEGIVCVHCGAPLDVLKGAWLAARPNIKDHYGFHVPRFVLEARVNAKKWGELKSAIDSYPPAKLANEVFGLPAGIAGRILSQREAMACCNPYITSFDSCWPMDSRAICNVVVGVDWSVTGGEASYTVISVLGYDYAGKCYLLFSERLNGIDILDQVRRVETVFTKFNAQMVASDRGVGVLQGQLLRNSLGPHRVIMVNYVAAKQYLRYDQQGQFMAADRTQAMDTMILKMKLGIGKFETPCWEKTQEFWSDALNVYEEETLNSRRLYRKDEGSTDDWLHSVTFGHIGYMLLTGQIQAVDILPDIQEIVEDDNGTFDLRY
jgi:hypothetical protein